MKIKHILTSTWYKIIPSSVFQDFVFLCRSLSNSFFFFKSETSPLNDITICGLTLPRRVYYVGVLQKKFLSLTSYLSCRRDTRTTAKRFTLCIRFHKKGLGYLMNEFIFRVYATLRRFWRQAWKRRIVSISFASSASRDSDPNCNRDPRIKTFFLFDFLKFLF